MNRGTLNQLFFTTVDRHASLPAAFRSKVGGAWLAITHRQTLERVQAISLGLRELGIKAGDKVVKLAGHDVRNVMDYTYILGEMKADVEYEIVVLRGGERLTLKIVPAKRP